MLENSRQSRVGRVKFLTGQGLLSASHPYRHPWIRDSNERCQRLSRSQLNVRRLR